MGGAGFTSRLTGPRTRALPAGHDTRRHQGVSRGEFQPALPGAAGGAGWDFGDATCPVLRTAKCRLAKCPRGVEKPKAGNILKTKGKERAFSSAKAENILKKTSYKNLSKLENSMTKCLTGEASPGMCWAYIKRLHMEWPAPGLRLGFRVFGPYPFPALWRLIQNSRFKIPDTCSPTPNTRFKIPDTRPPILNSRFKIPDTRQPTHNSEFPMGGPSSLPTAYCFTAYCLLFSPGSNRRAGWASRGGRSADGGGRCRFFRSLPG